MKKLLEKLYPNYTWSFEPEIATNENDFCADIETVLEYDENIIDDTILIEKEICFEAEEDDVFCHVYTDSNNNINRLFLNID